MCIHVPFTHTCTTTYHQNMIYLVGLPSVLYERPDQNERSMLNHCFCCFSGAFHSFSCAFHVLFMKGTTFHTKSITFHENKQNQVNMCVYIYHQTPPKYKIYLVGLPSVLYERPGQNERPVLNQLFLLLFRCFQCFSHTCHEKCHFSYKSTNFYENKQNWVNMCLYMHHLHIHAPHAPPNITKI